MVTAVQNAVAPPIDEFLRKSLMPVEGAIPRRSGIEMHRETMPAEAVGGHVVHFLHPGELGERQSRDVARLILVASDCLEFPLFLLSGQR